MNKLLNAIGFQTGWWACIWGVGHGFEIESIVFCIFLTGIHLSLSPTRAGDLKTALVAIGLGLTMDSILQYSGVIDFYGWSIYCLSPFWLWMLWALFGLTFNSSLAFMKKQSFITTALIASLAGPINYLAGARLGAAAFDGSASHLLILALAWMIALPLMIHTQTKFSYIKETS